MPEMKRPSKLHRTIWALFIASFALCCHAQSVTTKFFKDRSMNKEVTANRARFSETVSHEADGRVTTEIRNLKENEVIMRETYKGDEPFGVWFYKGEGEDIFL